MMIAKLGNPINAPIEPCKRMPSTRAQRQVRYVPKTNRPMRSSVTMAPHVIAAIGGNARMPEPSRSRRAMGSP